MKSAPKRQGLKPFNIQQTKKPDVQEDMEVENRVKIELIEDVEKEKATPEKEALEPIDIGTMLEVIIKTEETEEPSPPKQKPLKSKKRKKTIDAPFPSVIESQEVKNPNTPKQNRPKSKRQKKIVAAPVSSDIESEGVKDSSQPKQKPLRSKKQKKTIVAAVSSGVGSRSDSKKSSSASDTIKPARKRPPRERPKDPFFCSVCQKQFARKHHLDRHMKGSKCSGLPLPSFPCELCNRVYNRKDNLQEHLRAHAGMSHRRKNHKCPFCDKAFHGQSLLAIHVRKHTGERPFSCDFCPKKFSSAAAQSKHRMTHTGEQPYSCNECERKFTLKCTLSRHLRTHTEIKPHTCSFCSKTFTHIRDLNAHLFYHTEGNILECDECGKLFKRKNHLQMHQLTVHKKLESYTCEYSPKQFFTCEKDITLHSVLHSDEKIKIQLLAHTEEVSRSCQKCGRTFIGKDCLLCYIRTRNRDIFSKILFDEEDGKDANIVNSRILSQKDLTDSIQELLYLLIDESTLVDFGWQDKAVVEVLELVIQQCGHTPVNQQSYEYMDRLRENVKLLFSVVIDDNSVKILMNNQTIDVVILHVLRLAKTYNLL